MPRAGAGKQAECCMAGSESTLRPGEVAWRRDRCEPGGPAVGSGGEQ